MKTITSLLACGVLALALIAGPGVATASAAGNAAKATKAAKAKRAKVIKRLMLTAFVVRQAAKHLNMKPAELRKELKGKSLAQVAEAHSASVTEMQAAIVAAFKAKADARVAAQKTTQDKADKAVARFEQRLAKLVNHVFKGKPGTPARAARKGILGVAAEYLGLTKAELKEQLPGNSLGQLADATPGKSAQGLQDALVAAVDAKLDALVAKGMKQERADKIMARFQDRVDDLVNKVFPEKA